MEDFPNNNEHKITLSEALATISAIEQNMRMGPFDSERDQIEDIRRKLLSSKILPKEAVGQAQEIEQDRSSQYR